MNLLNKRCPVCGKEYDKAISLRMHVLGKNTKDRKHRAFAKRYRIWLNGNMMVKCPVCRKNKSINRKRMLLGRSDGVCSRKCAGKLGGRGNVREVNILQKATAIRPCLKCGNMFRSQGSHNRLCEKCKKMNRGVIRYSLPTGGMQHATTRYN